jgi:hypothetical protein
MTTIPNIPREDLVILRKYIEGRDIDSEDAQSVERLCRVGLMKKGISLKRRKVTARTVGVGITMVSMAERDKRWNQFLSVVRQSPLKPPMEHNRDREPPSPSTWAYPNIRREDIVALHQRQEVQKVQELPKPEVNKIRTRWEDLDYVSESE